MRENDIEDDNSETRVGIQPLDVIRQTAAETTLLFQVPRKYGTESDADYAALSRAYLQRISSAAYRLSQAGEMRISSNIVKVVSETNGCDEISRAIRVYIHENNLLKSEPESTEHRPAGRPRIPLDVLRQINEASTEWQLDWSRFNIDKLKVAKLEPTTEKRRPGRPPGAKNKPK